MRFTKFDFMLFIGSVIMIILLSLTLPALGYSDQNVNASDIPEFNITAERFDWTGEFPDKQSAPAKGTLTYNSTIPLNGFGDESHVWLEGTESSGGIRLSLTESGASFAENAEFRLADFSTTPVSTETVEIQNVTEGDILQNFSYVIEVQWLTNETFTVNGQTEAEFTGEYHIRQRASGSTWLSSIPLIGGVLSDGWATVAWIGTIFWWVSATLVTTVLNIIGIIIDLVVFMFTLIYFIVGTYGSIITGANTGWATLVLTVPSLLFSVSFVKIVILFINILPFTGG